MAEELAATNVCAWCGRYIPDDAECYGLDAKARRGADLTDLEGEIIQLRLVLADKTFPAFVATSDSEAKRQGYDIVIMTCSEKCARSLKAAFDNERDVIERVRLAH